MKRSMPAWLMLFSAAMLMLLASCVAPLPIPHHVNSVRLKGTVLNSESGQPVDGAHVEVNRGEERTLRTKKDGTFKGWYFGQWRFIVVAYFFIPVDIARWVHQEQVSLSISSPGFHDWLFIGDYWAEEPRWATHLAYHIGPDITREIDFGEIWLMPEPDGQDTNKEFEGGKNDGF